ncbi:MAG TPA: hypothetical protein VE089_02530 [Nitrososphaeraceae archaeon]|jgi:hypothetical protein|nr:hypothetical protein [Nitrososphaeraceae archaeon]
MAPKKEEIKEEHETTIKSQSNESSTTFPYASEYESSTTSSYTRQRQEEQRYAVNRALDETKDNIRKTTDEARRDIPRYTQAANEYQEQTIQAAKDIADNYLDSQKEIINSYQSAWLPQIEAVNRTFWNYWMSPRRMTEIYGRMVSSFADTTIATTRVTNNAIFVHMETTKTLMQNTRENTKELSRIGVNAAKTIEHTARNMPRQDNDSASTIRTRVEVEENEDSRRQF